VVQMIIEVTRLCGFVAPRKMSQDGGAARILVTRYTHVKIYRLSHAAWNHATNALSMNYCTV
jgi:hypothetical protein